MPLRNITDTLQPRLWWNKSSRNDKASDIWKLLSKSLPQTMIYCVWEPLQMCQDLCFIWFAFSKGTWSQIRINYLFECRIIPSSTWICWSSCFSFFLLLQFEKSSIMWNRLCSGIIWKYIEATLQPRMVCCLLWGLGLDDYSSWFK